MKAAMIELQGREDFPEPVSELMQELLERSRGERVGLGDLADGMDGRSDGLILLALALPETIPMIGLSLILAIPIFVLGGYMLRYGREVPLPRWIRRRSIQRSHLEKAVEKTLPFLKRLERLSRPRWNRLATATRLQGGVCLVMAVILAVPMPGINILAAFGVAGTGLGMLQRDGAIIAVAIASSVLALAGLAALVTGVVALAG